MQTELKNLIQKLLQRNEAHKANYQKNETATREQLINPLLKCLGWDTSDPSLVNVDTKNEAGKIPDYTLLKNQQKVLVIEAKNTGVDAQNDKIIKQLSAYVHNVGLPFGLITNGLRWILLDVFQPNPDERIVWSLNLEQSADDYATEIQQLQSISYEQIEHLHQKVKYSHQKTYWETYKKEKLASPEQLLELIASAVLTDLNQHLPTKLKNSPFELVELKQLLGAEMQKLPNLSENIPNVPYLPKPKAPKKEKIQKLAITRQPNSHMIVKFPDGSIIENELATDTFAQVIGKIGAEKVNELGIFKGGINLVAKQKHPKRYSQHPLEDGWLVCVHSSTADKMRHLQNISKQLGLNLDIQLV